MGPKRWLASGKTPGPLAEGLKPQAKRVHAANHRQKIGPRLTGLARQRACPGQAGAARFVAGQIGLTSSDIIKCNQNFLTDIRDFANVEIVQVKINLI